MLIASSTALGYATSRRLSLRVRFLQQYLQFVSYINTEIRYTQRVLSEIINSYSDTKGEISGFLIQVKENLKSEEGFVKAWQDAAESLADAYGLRKPEKELISKFGKELGTTDVRGQISLCELNQKLVGAVLEVAKEEKEKKSKLYLMLGASAGISIAIILL